MPEVQNHDGAAAQGRQRQACEKAVLGLRELLAVSRDHRDRMRIVVADPKLACIDILPYGSSQVLDRDDILNIGGFSDAVFNVVSSFLSADQNQFVREAKSIEL